MQFTCEFNYLFYIHTRIYFILNLTFLISDAIKNRKILLLIKYFPFNNIYILIGINFFSSFMLQYDFIFKF